MPNHLHLIIVINDYDVWNIGNASLHSRYSHDNIWNVAWNSVGNAGMHSLHIIQNNNEKNINPTKNKLSNTIQWIKSIVTVKIREQFNDFEFGWQKSFYDRIIRNETELQKTRQYIVDNPLQWKFDKNNLNKI
jgi:REP element-mobilizing transposase RayT